jgi:hypothetical protein
MRIIGIYLLLLLIASCGLNSKKDSTLNSAHPNINYFYPYDSVPRIYCYRNIANGLDEEFHRIYGIKDSKGHHIVVEKYASTGRIIEAFNYNYDSLDVIDHMVVNRNNLKTQAVLVKTKLFPFSDAEQTWFASKYAGHIDSTLILDELKRKVQKKNVDYLVMDEEKRKAIYYSDFRRLTMINIFSKKETSLNTEGFSIFAEGFGLVEFYSKNKIAHYKLEKVLTQKEWKEFLHR